MKKLKFLFCLGGLTLSGLSLNAQKSVEDELKQMHARYQSKEYLSYDVQYLYALEKKPGVFIDTVNGHYKINRQLYWGRLDQVEYVQTDSLFISVYKEDKVILLNSSAPVLMQVNNQWDRFLEDAKGKMDVSVINSEGLRKISMRYHNDSLYKSIDFWYSPDDYLLRKIQYVMRQPEGLSDEDEDETAPVAGNEFVIIEIRFSNYNGSSFDKSIFATDQYVERKEKEFQPSKKYTDYTVLVGSPGLLN